MVQFRDPSGLASSMISSNDIISNDMLYEGIVLDYSIKHYILDDSLDKLTKKQVLYPTDIESMIYRIDALTALVDLLQQNKLNFQRPVQTYLFVQEKQIPAT